MVFFPNRKKLRGNAVRDESLKAAAVPATVSDEPAPKATGLFREGGKGDDPQARRPAVRTQISDRPAGVPDKEPDLDRDGIFQADTADLASPTEDGAAARHAVTILVCSTCRDEAGSDTHPRAGVHLARDARRAAADDDIQVRTVECLGNCKRRLSAALLRDGCWSYVFGDLKVDSGADLVAGARLFSTSADGLIPWRGRPESLKRGLVARIPPLAFLKDVP